MEINPFLLLVFLSSGLFLGWSLGANDAANIFGTAVATKMVRFKVAAFLASVFVILGAVSSGAGASETLGKLGGLSTLPAAFMAALAAAISVMIMTKATLPVSTSQAIVGAIIAWNQYSGMVTDLKVVSDIALSWILSPFFAALFAMVLYSLYRFFSKRMKTHLMYIDLWTRLLLIVVGSFGAFSLGANNIANVVGVFITSFPSINLNLAGIASITGTQVLFLLGGISIAVGIASYSERVMKTVGKSVFSLNPQSAFIVVLSTSLVMFLFASKDLKAALDAASLPSFPLVPVSSSQAVIGAVIGIGITRSVRNIQTQVLGKIVLGWLACPLVAFLICYFGLFFMENLFLLPVR